jgi:dUTP pyrophosphatase
MNVQLLDQNATVPSRATEGSAGYDLSALESGYIEPMGRAVLRTGISIELPPGTYGRVAPRSGLSVKHGIHVGAGVIDRDYRGEVCVLLYNLGSHRFEYSAGDRIAQLIVEKIHTPIVIVKDQLDDTKRGAGGFGSTGL